MALLYNINDTSASMPVDEALRADLLSKTDVGFICSRFDKPNAFDDVKILCESVLWQQPKMEVMIVRTQADRNHPWMQFGKAFSYCQARSYPLFSTSAKVGVNVKELFVAAATMAFNREKYKKERINKRAD
jgi:hypothetical protein